LLAAWCSETGSEPAHALQRIDDFQALLVSEGVELAWPDDLVLSEGDPHIHAM
jgi:hypothetical protein